MPRESGQLWLRRSPAELGVLPRLRVKEKLKRLRPEDTWHGVQATSSPLSHPCFWISGRKFGAKERPAPSLSPRAYFCRAVCLCSSFFDIQHFQTQISHRSSVSHRAGWPHGEFWSAGSRVFLQTGEHRPFYGEQGQGECCVTTIPLSLLTVRSQHWDHPLHTLTVTVTIAPGVLRTSGFIAAKTSRRQVMLSWALSSVIGKERRPTSARRTVMWCSGQHSRESICPVCTVEMYHVLPRPVGDST